jgi:hypothetical protein
MEKWDGFGPVPYVAASSAGEISIQNPDAGLAPVAFAGGLAKTNSAF